MRGKKAKALRRIAREVARKNGLQERELIHEPGKPKSRTAVNKPGTLRGVYRALKKEAKRRKVQA